MAFTVLNLQQHYSVVYDPLGLVGRQTKCISSAIRGDIQYDTCARSLLSLIDKSPAVDQTVHQCNTQTEAVQ